MIKWFKSRLKKEKNEESINWEYHTNYSLIHHLKNSSLTSTDNHKVVAVLLERFNNFIEKVK